MNKINKENYSEKICKICDIKPIRSCTNSLYFCQVPCYNDCTYYNSKYPDFENNDNFVKLLEIYFDCKNVKKIILNAILEDFMQNKANIDLSTDYYYSDLFEKCEKLKDAIKHEKWSI